MNFFQLVFNLFAMGDIAVARPPADEFSLMVEYRLAYVADPPDTPVPVVDPEIDYIGFFPAGN